MKRPLSIVYYFLFSIISILLLLLAVYSKSDYGGGDSVAHYNLSRFAFSRPSFFFDMWGKPVFTVFSSPFSQFGYPGLRVFNTLTGILAAFVTFRMARRLNYDNAILAFAFTLFSPIFLININTGMTEIIFSLMVILSFFLLLKNKPILAALIVSLMPFSRSEGVVFLPLFLLLFILLKNYRAIPFLLAGYVIYNLAGWIVLDKLFFVSDLNPYSVDNQPYGTGSFWFYFSNLYKIFGIPILLLIILGTILILWKKNFSFLRNRKELIEVSMVITFFGIIILQSILWWKGLFSVRGNLRYIVSVIPVGAIVGLKAYNFILDRIKLSGLFKSIISGLFIILVLYMPFTYFKIPKPVDKISKMKITAVDWLKNSPYLHDQIFYYDLTFPIMLGLNPQDPSRSIHLWHGLPSEIIPDSSILIWDTHYGGYEGHLDLNQVLSQPDFKLLHVFEPKINLKVIGGSYYRICVFQRIKDHPEYGITPLLSENFDEAVPESNIRRTDSLSYSGKYSIRFDSSDKYGKSLKWNITNMPGDGNYLFQASVMVYPLSDPKINSFSLVLSASKGDKTISYLSVNADDKKLQMGKWNKLSAEIYINPDDLKDVNFLTYIYNSGKASLLYDDMQVNYSMIYSK